jgi:hypothetical protein
MLLREAICIGSRSKPVREISTMHGTTITSVWNLDQQTIVPMLAPGANGDESLITEKRSNEREEYLNMVRIFVLAFLVWGVTLAEAHATTEPRCSPVSATLVFQDQQGRDVLKLELKSPTQTCTIYETDDAVGLYREPEMRVSLFGKTISVPNWCLMGLAFRLSDVTVQAGQTGVGTILIAGKTIGRGVRMRAAFHVLNNEISCNLSAE